MIDMAPLSRHDRIALAFSGGKDSTAVLYLLRDHLDRITVYHNDTGDLLPEIAAQVAHAKTVAPNFIHIRSDARGWIAANGMPTDLLPFSAHTVGQQAGQGVKMVTRYECCVANLMLPLWDRVRADGNTLMIRGTKSVDVPRLPALSGEVHAGIEIWHPIEGWSHGRVMEYLREVGAPHNHLYDHMTSAPECARCPAWWGENRAAYLRRFHPELHRDYMANLNAVAAEITVSIGHLRHELEAA